MGEAQKYRHRHRYRHSHRHSPRHEHLGDLVVQEELQHQTGACNGSNLTETTASSGMLTLGTQKKKLKSQCPSTFTMQLQRYYREYC